MMKEMMNEEMPKESVADKAGLIPVPEALKGQLEPQGTLEIDYTLTNDNGAEFIKVTGIEGQSLESEPESPMSRLKRKIGYKEEKSEEAMMM